VLIPLFFDVSHLIEFLQSFYVHSRILSSNFFILPFLSPSQESPSIFTTCTGSLDFFMFDKLFQRYLNTTILPKPTIFFPSPLQLFLPLVDISFLRHKMIFFCNSHRFITCYRFLFITRFLPFSCARFSFFLQLRSFSPLSSPVWHY
jgi:hypothetical protein